MGYEWLPILTADPDEPWIFISEEQADAGYLLGIGGAGSVRHDYHLIGRTPSGGIVARDPQRQR